MSRGRAFRRYKLQLAKRKAYVHMREWWGIDNPEPRYVGVIASTHCCPCSCAGCGNPRRHKWEEPLTWQELRADVSEKEQRKEV